jgi:NNP family nitrate/nitrite transporter-like MFS transporter
MERRADLVEEATYPKYRWLILFLAWMLYSLIAFNNTMTAVLYDLRFPIAQGGLGLTDQQFYACLTATSLAPIVLALFGGMLSDRFGVRWTVFVGSIIAAAGTLLRLVSTGFPDFFAFNLLLGIGLGVIGPNLPKLVGMWFPPKQIAISTALYMTALGIGSGLGLALGPLFSTWRSAILIMGVIFVGSVVIWFVFAKDRPKGYKVDGVEIVGVPFKEGFLRAVKTKSLWLIAFSYAMVAAIVTAYVNGVPLLLVEARGVPEKTAGLVIALAVLGYIFGTVFWVVLAEKIGVTKPIYMFCMIMSGIAGIIGYLLAPGFGLWLNAVFPGFFMGAGHPFIMQVPLRLREIGPRYAGVAAGVIGSLGHILSFTLLPYMFEPIWHGAGSWQGFGPFWAAFFLAAVLAVGGILYILAPETGRKAREKWEREAAEAQAYES